MITPSIEPLLSIIIPAKNEEQYIEQCLTSLQNSILTSKISSEIILVDNGSKDSTATIARSMGCRLYELPNGKISRLRNVGANFAKGEILAFLDADCVVDSKWIFFCMEAFHNERISVVGTRAIPDLKKATWVETSWFILMSGSNRPDFPEWIGTSNLFIRKREFFDVGGFDENLETAEDVNFCKKIRSINKIIFLEKRVDTIHLRESKTLLDLFKRELWRGKSSLRSWAKNFSSYREFLGVAVPAGNAVALYIMLLQVTGCFSFIPAIFVLILPLVLMQRKGVNFRLRQLEVKCFIIAVVYIFARTCSLHYEIYELSKRMMGKK